MFFTLVDYCYYLILIEQALIMKLIMLLTEPFKLNECNKKKEGEKEKKKLGLGGSGDPKIFFSKREYDYIREERECKVRFLRVGSNGVFIERRKCINVLTWSNFGWSR